MKAEQLLLVVHEKDRRALKALIKVYGDDVTTLLNGLHCVASRVAIASGVSPDEFAAGVKHHWDFTARLLDEIDARGGMA